jgi:hypothetical protein
LSELKRRLARFDAPAELPVAIERPSGLIVDALGEAGHPVVPIHPNVVRASRPRYRAAGGKSDAGDAYLLADLLRADGHRFRPLAPCSDEIKALRALVRGRDDLVATRVALANQLRGLLEGFWPGAAAIFAAVDSPIALAFLRRYPTPDSAARLGERRLAAFLGQHQYCGRRSAAALLARACNRRLRQALTCFADNSRHSCQWAADIYARARARGCRHPHAVRILGRAWTRVLWRARTDQQPYDPQRHLAANFAAGCHRLSHGGGLTRRGPRSGAPRWPRRRPRAGRPP